MNEKSLPEQKKDFLSAKYGKAWLVMNEVEEIKVAYPSHNSPLVIQVMRPDGTWITLTKKHFMESLSYQLDEESAKKEFQRRINEKLAKAENNLLSLKQTIEQLKIQKKTIQVVTCHSYQLQKAREEVARLEAMSG